MDQLWDVVRRSPITHFFLAVSIFSSAFCINIMQVLLYAIKPLDKELFQSLMYYLQASFLSRKWDLFMSAE